MKRRNIRHPDIKPYLFENFIHDLRNSLTIINGNLELIFLEKKRQKLGPSTLQLLKNIRSELLLMSNFLNTVKVEKGKKKSSL